MPTRSTSVELSVFIFCLVEMPTTVPCPSGMWIQVCPCMSLSTANAASANQYKFPFPPDPMMRGSCGWSWRYFITHASFLQLSVSGSCTWVYRKCYCNFQVWSSTFRKEEELGNILVKEISCGFIQLLCVGVIYFEQVALRWCCLHSFHVLREAFQDLLDVVIHCEDYFRFSLCNPS